MQVVTNIFHWDEVNHEIYFQATKENSPGERHLYKVNSEKFILQGVPENIRDLFYAPIIK